MNRLHIDFETRSTVDIKKTGVHVYAEHPTTDVWCAAYALDNGPIELWTPGEPCPPEIVTAVASGLVVAHNASFEQAIWHHVLTPRYGWPEPAVEQWRCTMAQCYSMSLPGALKDAAGALGLDIGKDMEGRDLMLRMAKPRKVQPDGTITWWNVPDRLERLYSYCKRDVEVEREIEKRLLPLSKSEQHLFALDMRINLRGVAVDKRLAASAKAIVATTQERLDGEMRRLTDMEVRACTNTAQLIGWLRGKGVETEAIAKDDLDDILSRDLDPTVRRVVELRKEAAKTSVAKIDALTRGTQADGRARGLLQYHAASTGRWAGRRFQPQNLPRTKTDDVDGAIDAILAGDVDMVDMLYGPPLTVVSDAIRGLIIARPKHRLMAADFSNIEGRVLAWLAGESWKLQAFREFDAGTGADLYKLAYARGFGVEVKHVSKDDRQVGKVMELALGYQGGVRAFQKMAVNYGVKISDERADEIKVAWRESNPNIKQFWYDIEEAAIEAVRANGRSTFCGKLAFKKAGSFLFMRLPSGRLLTYPYPKIAEVEVPWGGTKPQLQYKGVDSYTRKWGECSAYGGLLVENATQAVARDVMAEAIVRLEQEGYPVVLTVHDEAVAEVPDGFGTVEEFERTMKLPPLWIEGCPIAAEAWEGARYRK